MAKILHDRKNLVGNLNGDQQTLLNHIEKKQDPLKKEPVFRDVQDVKIFYDSMPKLDKSDKNNVSFALLDLSVALEEVIKGQDSKAKEWRTVSANWITLQNNQKVKQEVRSNKANELPKTPNSQIDQTTNVVKDNTKPDLFPKDPNLVLAEKLVKDLQKLVNNQPSSQEKNDFLELIKETKGSNTQITFEDRKALEKFQSSYYRKSWDLDLQDANKEVVLDNSDSKLQQAIEKNLEVIKKLSARQEPQIETELKELVQSMQAVDPKFYDKVKIPKTTPSLEASEEKVKEYNVAMRSEKSQEIQKRIKRAFKSARVTVKGIGSAISNKVTALKEGGKEWKDKVKTKVNRWRGRS